MAVRVGGRAGPVAGGNRCHDLWAKDHPGGRPRPYWNWEPTNCRLEDIDAAKFCRVMSGRKGLLLVGAQVPWQGEGLRIVLRSWKTPTLFAAEPSCGQGSLCHALTPVTDNKADPPPLRRSRWPSSTVQACHSIARVALLFGVGSRLPCATRMRCI